MVDHLRPQEWSEYIGQDRIKNELDIRINSAIKDNRALDHILLAGPPGAGKTSLAEIIARKLDEIFRIVTMPITHRALIRLVREFEGIVLFDEIHRCSKKEQEMLLPLLEFGYVADSSGKNIESEWLTVIGATTEKQHLISPLIDRFEIKPEYADYTDEEITLIAKSMGHKAGLDIPEDVAVVFGQAATGTPRRARQFILGYRDLLNSTGEPPTAEDVLHLCQTEWDGLTTSHIRYLETLALLGGAKGIDIVVSLLRQPKPLVLQWEHLLIQKGFISLGERGRELTQKGQDRIGTKIVKSQRRQNIESAA